MLAKLAVHSADRTSRRPVTQIDADRTSLKTFVNHVISTSFWPGTPGRWWRPFLAPLTIDPRSGELARLLLATEPEAAFALIETLHADGRSMSQLWAGLFEPAARALGALWQSDDCSEFDVSLGLGHLQLALRRASVETSTLDVPQLPLSVPHAVLLAPCRREPHLLGSVIASEMFWRAGWEVRGEFPESDAALNQLVHDWFDVLDLSFSGAFTREHRLPTMASSIRAAPAQSLNPALTVIVDGRVFYERPDVFADGGADAGSTSALGVVLAASIGAKT